MRAITPREKKTIRVAAVLLLLYLLFLYGSDGWRFLEERRDRAEELRLEADRLLLQIEREKTKEASMEKLRASLAVDLAAIEDEAVVAKAVAAVRNAAKTHAIQLGPAKEIEGRAAGRERARIQIEGRGMINGAAGFLHDLYGLPYALLVDQINLQTAPGQPGAVMFTLSISVPDYRAWKQGGNRDA